MQSMAVDDEAAINEETSDLWVCLPQRAVGVLISFLCGSTFVWFHQNISHHMMINWSGVASRDLLSCYAACCLVTILICLVRPGPSLWPLLRNFRMKSFSQWTFVILGPALLLTNLLFIYSIQLTSIELTLMMLGIVFPIVSFLFDLINSFHFRSIRCRTKSGRPKHLAVPDTFETIQSLVGCVLSSLVSLILFYANSSSTFRWWWVSALACLACTFFYYSTTHVYYKFQRTSRVAAASYIVILVLYGLYCITVWCQTKDELAPNLDILDLPQELAYTATMTLWNLIIVMGGIFAIIRIGLAPSAVCWTLGGIVVNWICNLGDHGFPNMTSTWTLIGLARTCGSGALAFFVATLMFDLKTFVPSCNTNQSATI
eukprot:Gregarina_sp_Poly_1__3303@NODE_194_length_11600_cov_132_592994_g173_i0_p6_GENE_NODE_194_length_11600_cov_132_592994_g173_i0NODE_194_length_11600_cov_132_592994_g173_i0_p6_ORF_typecomplete_len373_score20_23SPC25/PF06703_11/0_67SPC25/PF06703_11/1_4e02_NODE_194_length_11600_cov_132_592994_g173_i056276745